MPDIQNGAVIVLDYKEVTCFAIDQSICKINFAYWLYNFVHLMDNVYRF